MAVENIRERLRWLLPVAPAWSMRNRRPLLRLIIPDSGGCMKILIVDDEKPARSGLLRLLNDDSITTSWSARPATAPRPCSWRSLEPDIVLMDIACRAWTASKRRAICPNSISRRRSFYHRVCRSRAGSLRNPRGRLSAETREKGSPGLCAGGCIKTHPGAGLPQQ